MTTIIMTNEQSITISTGGEHITLAASQGPRSECYARLELSATDAYRLIELLHEAIGRIAVPDDSKP